MSDLDQRTAERAWRAEPTSQALLSRAIAELRRAGASVPGTLWNARVQPERVIASDLDLAIWVEPPPGGKQLVGRTPGSVRVPEHRWLWVTAEGGAHELPRVVEEIRAKDISGVELSRRHTWRAADLRLLASA